MNVTSLKTDTTTKPESGRYNFTAIEAKWQAFWEKNGTFHVANPGEEGAQTDKPKFYILDFFPYPSGEGLHVGHPLGYCATDIIARHKRMCGYNVLHPMGFDSFGLPAEQYAIATNVHPAVTTAKAIEKYRRQLKMFGFSYDWDRELATSDVGFYKFTQWMFTRMFQSWFDDECRWTAPNGDATIGRALPISKLQENLQSGQWTCSRPMRSFQLQRPQTQYWAQDSSRMSLATMRTVGETRRFPRTFDLPPGPFPLIISVLRLTVAEA